MFEAANIAARRSRRLRCCDPHEIGSDEKSQKIIARKSSIRRDDE
jgi:hypothetical protein